MTVFKHLDNIFVIGILEAYWDLYEEVGINRYMDYSYLRQVWDYHSRILEHIKTGRFDNARRHLRNTRDSCAMNLRTHRGKWKGVSPMQPDIFFMCTSFSERSHAQDLA